MMLSAHFSFEEAIESDTAERYGIKNIPSPHVMAILMETAQHMEIVRTILGRPIKITSWFRCLKLNRLLKSKDTSDHIQGYGVDFKCPAYGTPIQIIKRLVDAGIKFDQMIQEGTWVHISFHPRMRGQVLTAVFKPGKPTTYKLGL